LLFIAYVFINGEGISAVMSGKELRPPVRRIEIPGKPSILFGYRFPLDGEIEIFQGYNGPWSHFGMARGETIIDNRFFLDLILPIGSVVLAAKSGRVYGAMDYYSGCYEGIDLGVGLDCITNLMILEHSDGECSLYAHLGRGSALLRDGMLVEKGQPIARTGKSGWIGPVPHLHFGVFKSTGNEAYTSHPVQFDDYSGALEHRLAVSGQE